MPFFVSRQRYYYSGKHVVEVTSGGLDYAGADMLGIDYPGEGKEYADPREAVEAAIEICRSWRADRKSVATKTNRYDAMRPSVAVGATAGMGLELEPTTFKEARAWANKHWESLPKCGHCGEPLPDKRNRYKLIDFADDTEYCSEYCADKAYEFYMKDMEESEANDNG